MPYGARGSVGTATGTPPVMGQFRGGGYFSLPHVSQENILSTIRTLVGVTGLSAILLLQACGKAEEAKAPVAAPAAAAPSAPAAATLALTDTLTAYNAASAADRRAVIPLALEKVKAEIDKKGKSDSDIADEVLPCMNSVNDGVTAEVRATQPVLDLAAVCLTQLGYKK